MYKVLLFCLSLFLLTSGSVFAADGETAASEKPAIHIDKNSESGRGAFELNNLFYDYCIEKFETTAEIYRCRHFCIEDGYPVYIETNSVEEAVKASGCFMKEE